jgi:hypothetical protein
MPALRSGYVRVVAGRFDHGATTEIRVPAVHLTIPEVALTAAIIDASAVTTPATRSQYPHLWTPKRTNRPSISPIRSGQLANEQSSNTPDTDDEDSILPIQRHRPPSVAATPDDWRGTSAPTARQRAPRSSRTADRVRGLPAPHSVGGSRPRVVGWPEARPEHPDWRRDNALPDPRSDPWVGL